MGNVLHVIFCYFIDTQEGVVRVERLIFFASQLLLHKGDANNVLPTAIAYCCVRDTGIVYRVPYRAVCTVIRWCTGVSFLPYTERLQESQTFTA